MTVRRISARRVEEPARRRHAARVRLAPVVDAPAEAALEAAPAELPAIAAVEQAPEAIAETLPLRETQVTPAEADVPVPTTVPVPERRRPWTVWRVVRWGAGVLGLVVLSAMGWGAYKVYDVQTKIYKPLPPTATVVVAAPTPKPAGTAKATAVGVLPTATPDMIRELPAGRFNILVMGTDKRSNDPEHWARSDTMLLANVDTISRTVRIMSIPRDLIVDIPDYGLNKVNSAYLFGEYYQLEGGGQALAVQTISDYFNVPVDYYVTVNFEGFRKVIDTVGGINVDVPYSLDDYNYPTDDEGDPYGETHVHFDEGMQHMDGKTALRYARTRHADNDFARSKRQLQIIMAVRQKAMSLDLLPKVPTLIDDLAGMVETNIPFDQQIGLAQLGYNIDASRVMTAAIDSTMIVPDNLPDGSEGFSLDWDVASPMLDEFFGVDSAVAGADAVTVDGEESSTEQRAAPSARGTATAKRPEATPSAAPRKGTSESAP
jgi:LCP family protein required for cell wall assembly